MKEEAKSVRVLIQNIFSTAHALSDLTGRPFTPDGHMVGSMGEAFAKYFYGVELYPPSHPTHDGEWKGRQVQIKATQRTSVDLKGETELLLVLKILPDGTFEEIYSGDGVRPWKALTDAKRKPMRTGEISIQLNLLRKLQENVLPEDRIPRIAEA